MRVVGAGGRGRVCVLVGGWLRCLQSMHVGSLM